MAGFIGEEQVRRVKEGVDLVQLVSEYVPVQKAGRNFKACCPFHGERTPSFEIYPEDQHYHCYGCGAHGDAITLIREKENLEFIDAVEILARRAGIELEYQQRGADHLRRGDRDRYLELMERTTRYYENILWRSEAGAPARAYLQRRGLGEAVCRAFRLGWAPGRGRLVRAVHRQGLALPDLQALDLAMERDGHLVDRFFDRLMFPICNRFGSPVAFSGRLLPEAEAAAKAAGRGVGKYVNSTDTPLYHKGSVVFNLHRARTCCRDAGRLIVMEGPTDVMAADQAGVGECVAVLGTALTERHARQLGSLIGDRGALILLFDGDAAGRANSVKAVATCLAAGVPSQVAVLPAGQDPAELLGDGAASQREAFEAVLTERTGDVAHLLAAFAPRPHELDQRALLAVVDKLLVSLRPIDDRDLREAYLEQAADYFGIDPQRLVQRLQQTGSGASPRADRPESRSGLDRGQETVLRLLLRHPELRPEAFDDLGCEPSQFPEPWSTVIGRMVAEPMMDVDSLLAGEGSVADGEVAKIIHRLCGDCEADVDQARVELRQATEHLHLRHVTASTRRLRHQLRGHGDGSAEEERLFRESFELQRRLNQQRDQSHV